MQSRIKTIATIILAMCAINSNVNHQPNVINNSTTIQNNLNIYQDNRIVYSDNR